MTCATVGSPDNGRPVLEAMVEKTTGVRVLTLHHVGTATGEEIVLFTLAESPILPQRKEEMAGLSWAI